MTNQSTPIDRAIASYQAMLGARRVVRLSQRLLAAQLAALTEEERAQSGSRDHRRGRQRTDQQRQLRLGD